MKWIGIGALLLSLAGCAEDKTINGVTYGSYGLINKSEVKDARVNYRTSMGNVIWGVILCETIVMPIYVFGFALYEPTGLKP